MQPLFHGWRVVAGVFAVTFVGFGAAYTFSALFTPLQQEFAASRGAVSAVFSIAGFLYFALGVVSGPLADRWGARPLVVSGMVVLAAGLALAAAARSLTEVLLAYGLGVGLGVGLAYAPALGAVQRWFVARRGLASGLAVSGIGVGTLVLPPLAAALAQSVGWRGAYLVLAAVTLVVGGGMALLVESDPARRGLAPDGAPPASAVPAQGLTLGQAVRTRRFAGLYAGCLVCGLGVFTPFAHLVPYALDRGIAPTRAALLLALIGAGSTAGRFLLGGLADRLGRLPALLSMFVGMTAAMGIWAAAYDFAMLAAFALAYGVFYGGWVALLPALVADYFGGRAVGSIIGVLYTSVAFGTLVGPIAAGRAYDAAGSYLVPIVLAAVANLVAAAVVAATARTPTSSR
jgi:MFS family permease